MNINKFALPVAMLTVTLAAFGCSSATPTPKPLTIDVLKNAEYQSEFPASKQAKLTDGVYQEEIVPGAASKLTLKLLDQYATGDLNGDGVADAAVVLAANMGGSGTFVYLAAVLDDRGMPKHIASASLGDRVQIKSVSIDAGQIVLDMVTHGPNDPICCPTQQVTRKFKLQSDTLVPSN